MRGLLCHSSLGFGPGLRLVLSIVAVLRLVDAGCLIGYVHLLCQARHVIQVIITPSHGSASKFKLFHMTRIHYVLTPSSGKYEAAAFAAQTRQSAAEQRPVNI